MYNHIFQPSALQVWLAHFSSTTTGFSFVFAAEFYRASNTCTYTLPREYSFHQSSSLHPSFLRVRRSQTKFDELILHAAVSHLFQSTVQANGKNTVLCPRWFVIVIHLCKRSACLCDRSYQTDFYHLIVYGTVSRFCLNCEPTATTPFSRPHVSIIPFLVFASLAHPLAHAATNRAVTISSPMRPFKFSLRAI